MKTIKKIFFLFVLITMMVTTPGTIYAKPSKKQIIKKYEKFITKQHYKKPYHLLYHDINKDKTPELLIYQESGVRYKLNVYTYKQNKIKKIKPNNLIGVVDVGTNKKTKKLYVMFTTSAFDAWIQEYTLKNTTLKKADKWTANTNRNTNKTKYTKNGKKISEKKFNQYLNNITWYAPKTIVPTKK